MMGRYTWEEGCEGCVLACDLIETSSTAVVYAHDQCPVHGVGTELIPNEEDPVPHPVDTPDEWEPINYPDMER